jgi:putative chitinase
MTIDQLKECLPHASEENIEKLGLKLIEAMIFYGIDTARRQAAFLAQIAHESGSLRYVREIASGEAYEGRKDLGNTEPGDGKRFKGRGLIQITGRANYRAVSEALKYDFVSDPEALELPGPACYSAAWFWNSRSLNFLADEDEFEKITRKINGGVNGLMDRLDHWETAKRVLGINLTT